MARTAKATPMSREAAKAPIGASTIASLESRATPASATAVKHVGVTVGNNFTGQYLYERFITDGAKEDQTKMDIVRSMVQAVDTESYKKILADFVGIAKSYYDKAVNEAKQGGIFDEKNPTPAMEQAGATLKTARNNQTLLRIGYGALKHASKELDALGAGPQTGIALMRVLGTKALAKAGLNWDGTKAETSESKAARKAQSLETATMLEVQQEMPKKDGEERTKYLDRILTETDKRMEAKRTEVHAKQVAELVKKVRELAGPVLDEVLDALLSGEGEPAAPDVALH